MENEATVNVTATTRRTELTFRDIRADEIELRIGTATEKGYTLLLYKNARVDMAMLDETIGQMNWQRDHKEVKGNLYCGIGIFDEYMGTWVWKWDCGAESFSDKEKGEASDSFKRAGFNWGIGRELYTAPFIWINCECENKKVPPQEQKRVNGMRVREIAIANKKIVGLEIIDNKGQVVYTTRNLPKQESADKSKAQEENIAPKFKHTGEAIIGVPADENNLTFALQEVIATDYPDTAEAIKTTGLDLTKVAKAFGVALWQLSLDDIKTAIKMKEEANEKVNKNEE